MEKHFYLEKMDIIDLPTVACNIYPVLCSLADFETDNWFQISLDNLSKMSGMNIQTIRKGMEYLQTAKLLQRKKTTEGTRHFYIYRIKFIRRKKIKDYKGWYIVFFTSIIDSGIWAKLSPRAKTLYLVARSVAKFDYELYMESELPFGDHAFRMEWMEKEYLFRRWDAIIDHPFSNLCRLAGIESTNIKQPMQQLRKYKLLKKVDNNFYKVYLRPKIPEHNPK